jgi:AcrR family transcriptional regulator
MSTTGPPPAGTPADPPAMRADARRNRQLLLAAALAAFTEHGADDASLDEIARRAGVGIGTLYRHFPTRQSLLEAVYRDQVEELCARTQEHAATPAVALEAWLRNLMTFAATKRNLTRSMMAGPDGKNSEVARSCSTLMREAVAGLLAQAQQAGEIRPDVDATDVLRMSHALAVACELPSVHPDQPERLLKVVLDGLRAAPQQAGPPAS